MRPERARASSTPAAIDFRDIASEAGLTAENISGDADNKRYILETTGDGVAIFDLDNDGLMDVLLVNATTMDGKGRGEIPPAILSQCRKSAFCRYHAEAGLGKARWGGALVGDYDNDGYGICSSPTYGHSVLYHNEGNGTF